MYESEYESDFKYGIEFSLRKYHQIQIYAPSEDVDFNLVYFVYSSRKSHDITKNQWSFFRMTKKPMNAREWHHICHVYSVPKKLTGIETNPISNAENDNSNNTGFKLGEEKDPGVGETQTKEKKKKKCC